MIHHGRISLVRGNVTIVRARLWSGKHNTIALGGSGRTLHEALLAKYSM